MEKVILTALEIADHEVRLLVGEFFNTRLNVLKVEQVEIIKDPLIEFDRRRTSEAVRKALINASRNLGVIIERVLLLVPSLQVELKKDRFDLLVNGQLEADIYAQIMEDGFKHCHRDDKVTANVLIRKLFLNGVPTRKSLVGELCDTLSVETDVYYVEKHRIYELVGCVEEVGCSVIDIALDSLCFGKEATLFDLSLDCPVIGIEMNRNSTILSLFHKGGLVSSQRIESGSVEWIMKLCYKYQLSVSTASKLLYLNANVQKTPEKDVPLYIWQKDKQNHMISSGELHDLISEPITHYLDTIVTVSQPILDFGPSARFVLSGEASLIDGMAEYIKEKTGHEAMLYVPDTFGARDGSLSSLLGLFYLYKDNHQYRRSDVSSVNQSEFKKVISEAHRESQSEESITRRLKNFFLDRNHKKEGL